MSHECGSPQKMTLLERAQAACRGAAHGGMRLRRGSGPSAITVLSVYRVGVALARAVGVWLVSP